MRDGDDNSATCSWLRSSSLLALRDALVEAVEPLLACDQHAMEDR